MGSSSFAEGPCRKHVPLLAVHVAAGAVRWQNWNQRIIVFEGGAQQCGSGLDVKFQMVVQKFKAAGKESIEAAEESSKGITILPPAPSAPHASTASMIASVAEVVASPTAPQSTMLHSRMAVVLLVATITITKLRNLDIFSERIHNVQLAGERVVSPLGPGN
eukprot:CAMPEP_0119477302 /NCGR_PEP_ID=MMETSP1344-20130328/7497_1 /TAXON_ID=236787 /ORGANISM="Florenciella parvula, Strain CCMP2471" /LENGTH=161 /DNA_ID=CAMNT_0007511265 /DNA_START=140 /DNA_END=626 /DNA_ORIENTATION=-